MIHFVHNQIFFKNLLTFRIISAILYSEAKLHIAHDKNYYNFMNVLFSLNIKSYIMYMTNIFGGTMKLNKLANVRTGLVLSRKEAKAADKCCEYRQLNLKAVNDNGTINISETIPYSASEELASNYLTQVGDIIVKTSEPYTAVYITEEYAGFVIPSHFVVVRVDITKALPQYIAWYLNKDRIKKSFSMSCTGMLKQIKPSIISETEIKLPTIERQRQVVELYDISRKEIELYEKLLEQKKVYYKELINKVNRVK